MPASAPKPDLGLYVHWPFCRKKCPYCDFNSHVSTIDDGDAFGTALCLEMSYMANMLPDCRALKSIFFGGGTPSLMPPAVIGKIITHAENTFGFAPMIEITAEANPTSVEAKIMTEFYHAGVNRVSMGVQSLDDDILKFLGREHSVAEALSAIETVRHSFENLSIDLIYATAGQTTKAWQNTLSQALAFDVPHLSLYQLTIEQGTVFYTRQRHGETLNLDDDRAADLYDLTQHMTAAAGLPAYEISNHAKPGAKCQHNMNYWRAADWVGIGPGAHGRLTVPDGRLGLATRRSPAAWLDSVESDGHAIDIITEDDRDETVAECLMMGLRLGEGVHLSSLDSRFGPRGSWLDETAMGRFVESGMLEIESGCLRATLRGRLLLDGILADLLPAS